MSTESGSVRAPAWSSGRRIAATTGTTAAKPPSRNVWLSEAAKNSSLRILRRDPVELERSMKDPSQWPTLGCDQVGSRPQIRPTTGSDVTTKNPLPRRPVKVIPASGAWRSEAEDTKSGWVKVTSSKSNKVKTEVPQASDGNMGSAKASPHEPQRVAEESVEGGGARPLKVLTDAELEAKKIEKRRRDKERKKLAKEEKKRKKLYESKFTKITVISKDVLDKLSQPTPTNTEDASKASKPVRFLDQEYPALDSTLKRPSKTEVVLSRIATDHETGLPISDDDSGSDWETDVDEGLLPSQTNRDMNLDSHNGTKNTDKADATVASHISYSGVLRQELGSGPKVRLPNDDKADANDASNSDVKKEEAKKVKKSDPITFDLLSAVKVKTSKSTARERVKVVVKKPSSTSKIVGGGNKLDATAPLVRRGKERLQPKTKRKTKMKSIILAERERRRNARMAKSLPTEKSESEEPAQPPEASPPTVSTSIPKSDIDHDESSKENAFTENVAADAETKANSDAEEIKTKEAIHSRKFRGYCDHMLSSKVDEHVKKLLSDIVRFQDNMFNKDPVKAKARRRYVVGLREVKKFLTVKKITLLVVAPDIEPVAAKGGLNDYVESLLSLARENNVPYIFSLNRRNLGKAVVRKAPTACIGVMNYQGSDENFKSILALLPDLRAKYKERLEEELKKLKPVPDQATAKPPSYPRPKFTVPIEDPPEEIKQAFLKKLRDLSFQESSPSPT